ncbi:MAG: hypothetical protein V5B40_06145 [Candidatus Accumulibacter meliphilus]|uniref:hypothetical protein n=1 Tax=Candidatus Accumulibacter meliphilus TaxID=2211374 RepID=UPI002FC3B7EC
MSPFFSLAAMSSLPPFADSPKVGARLNGGDEIPAGLRGVGLELGGVHGFFLLDACALAGLDGGEKFGLEFGDVAFDLGFGFQIDRR